MALRVAFTFASPKRSSRPFDWGVSQHSASLTVGDILERSVAHTIAKQIAKKVDGATVPFQYALSTKAGCECVAHVLQSLTDLSPEVTVTSVNSVGAYDLISRNAMLEGLLRMRSDPPSCECSTVAPTYLWEDEMGVTQHIAQGEGGSKAPSCPCCLHWANTSPLSKHKRGCLTTSICLLSLMTSTSRTSRAGSLKLTLDSPSVLEEAQVIATLALSAGGLGSRVRRG